MKSKLRRKGRGADGHAATTTNTNTNPLLGPTETTTYAAITTTNTNTTNTYAAGGRQPFTSSQLTTEVLEDLVGGRSRVQTTTDEQNQPATHQKHHPHRRHPHRPHHKSLSTTTEDSADPATTTAATGDERGDAEQTAAEDDRLVVVTSNDRLLFWTILVTAVAYTLTLLFILGMVTFLDFDPFGRSGTPDGLVGNLSPINDGNNKIPFLRIHPGHVVNPVRTTHETEEKQEKKPFGGEDFEGFELPVDFPDIDSPDVMYQKLLDSCIEVFLPPKRLFQGTKDGKPLVCGEQKPLKDSLPPNPKLFRHLAISQHPILYELLISPSSSWSQDPDTGKYENGYYEGRLNLTIYIQHPTEHIGLHMNTRFVKAFMEEASDHRTRTAICPPVFVVNRCHSSKPVRCPIEVQEYTNESMILLTFDEPLDVGEFYVLVIGPFFGEILPATEHEDWLLGDDVNDEFRGGLFGDYERGNHVVRRIRTVFPMHRARTVFPCMDQPHRRARFQLRLQHSIVEHAFAAAGASDDQIVRRDMKHESPHLVETVFSITAVSIAPHQFGFFTKNINLNPKTKSYSVPGGSLTVEVHKQKELDVISMFDESTGDTDQYVDDVIEQIINGMLKLKKEAKIVQKLKKLFVLITDPVGKTSVESYGIMTLSMELMRDQKKVFGVRISQAFIARKMIGQWMNGMIALGSWEEVCILEGYLTVATDRLLTELGYAKESDVRLKMNSFRWESLKLVSGPLIQTFGNLIEAETVCEHKAAVVFAMIQLVYKDIISKLHEHFSGKVTGGPITTPLVAWVKAVEAATNDAKSGKLLETYFTQPGYPIVSARYGNENGAKSTAEIILTQYSFSKFVVQGQPDESQPQNPAQKAQDEEFSQNQYFAMPIRLPTRAEGQKNHWTVIPNQETNVYSVDLASIPNQMTHQDSERTVNQAGTSKKQNADIFNNYLKRIQLDNSSAALVLSRNLYTADNYLQMMTCWREALKRKHVRQLLNVFSAPLSLSCLTSPVLQYWVPRILDDLCFGMKSGLIPLDGDPEISMESKKWNSIFNLAKAILSRVDSKLITQQPLECDSVPSINLRFSQVDVLTAEQMESLPIDHDRR